MGSYKAKRERRITVQDSVDAQAEEVKELSDTLINLENLIIQSTTFIQDYRDEKLEELSGYVEETLDFLFPLENFKVKLKADTFRGKERVRLLTGKGENLAPIKMQHGRCLRQVASFSITTRIQELKQCYPIFMDEALSSGDPVITATMSKLLRDLIDKEVQFTFVEHKHSIYNNLPRLQIELRKDTVTDMITEVKAIDYTQIS